MKTESLYQVEHQLAFALSDLQNALKSANAVEAIVILPMIERTAILLRDVKALTAAVQS